MKQGGIHHRQLRGRWNRTGARDFNRHHYS